MTGLALTVRQEKFCLEYAKSGNARQAYKAAGYSCKKDSTADVNACNLLKNPKIKERLAELAEEVKTASIADIVEMQQILTAIIRQEAVEEIVVDGLEKITKKPAIRDVISAIEKLGKMQGAFVDKVEAEISPIVLRDDVVK